MKIYRLLSLPIPTIKNTGRFIVLLGVFICLSALGACLGGYNTSTDWKPPELKAFSVVLSEGSNQEIGSPTNPIAFSSEPVSFSLDVEAIGRDGNRLEEYEGWLLVRSVPGEITEDTKLIHMQNGFVSGQNISITYGYGSTSIWVEDAGYGPDDECNDGLDNDNNGYIDYPADHGCTGESDRSEGGGTYVTGVGPVITFAEPTIRDVQYNPDPQMNGVESPLMLRDVTLQTGILVVTNVVINGFYVTDLADTAFNSLFVFNFNYPENLIVGDRLCYVSGGVQEHVGMTQLVFPSWQVNGMPSQAEAEEGGDPIFCFDDDEPAPPPVIPIELDSAKLRDWPWLEGIESSVVTVKDLTLSTQFIDCDFNGSGAIDGSGETVCRNDCQDDLACTELSSYREYDQWKISSGGATLYISAAMQVANFDVLADCWEVEPDEDEPASMEKYGCPERSLSFLTGNLKHIALTSSIQYWVIEPRFHDDLGEIRTQ